MRNDFMGYSLFLDDDNTTRQTFNRTITANNIKEDLGEDSLKEYIQQFSENEQKLIWVMAKYIQQKGVDEVSRQILKEGNDNE